MSLREIYYHKFGGNIKIFNILCTKYMASSEAMTPWTHLHIHIDVSRTVSWTSKCHNFLIFNRFSSSFHCFVRKVYGTVSGQLPRRTISHRTGIGPDEWFYSVVGVLAGSIILASWWGIVLGIVVLVWLGLIFIWWGIWITYYAFFKLWKLLGGGGGEPQYFHGGGGRLLRPPPPPPRIDASDRRTKNTHPGSRF